MAKKNKNEWKPSQQQVEAPGIKWKVVAQIGLGFAIVWVTVIVAYPVTGWWGIGGAGLLTAAALGFGVWLFRMSRKAQGVASILQQATDEAGRKQALEQLEAGDQKDALNALARAQLLSQEDPEKALEVLETIDLKKASALIADDVRANRAYLYLLLGRHHDARPLAEQIRLDKQPNEKSRAMYAAVIAETFARTGKAAEAVKLFETYKADDPAYGDMKVPLLRAQVFAFHANGDKGKSRQAMSRLRDLDVNLLGGFMQKGNHPELVLMAREMAKKAMPPQKIKMRMKP
ncbi:MAG: hypothetical protein IT379_19675 [Deltaproteobacteria bacterium]|nr:hypothetical protein [Deltaproteobacteria bacterium]